VKWKTFTMLPGRPIVKGFIGRKAAFDYATS